MIDALIDAEDELNRLCSLLVLFEMAAGSLPADTGRPLLTGIEVAVEVAIQLQNRLASIRAGSTADSCGAV